MSALNSTARQSLLPLLRLYEAQAFMQSRNVYVVTARMSMSPLKSYPHLASNVQVSSPRLITWFDPSMFGQSSARSTFVGAEKAEADVDVPVPVVDAAVTVSVTVVVAMIVLAPVPVELLLLQALL